MRQQIYTLSDGRKVSAPATVRGVMQEIGANAQQINTLMHQGYAEEAEALSDRDCVLQEVLLGLYDPKPEENAPEPTGDTTLYSRHEYMLKAQNALTVSEGIAEQGEMALHNEAQYDEARYHLDRAHAYLKLAELTTTEERK